MECIFPRRCVGKFCAYLRSFNENFWDYQELKKFFTKKGVVDTPFPSSFQRVKTANKFKPVTSKYFHDMLDCQYDSHSIDIIVYFRKF